MLEARVPRKSTKTIKTMKIMIGLRSSKEIPIVKDKSVVATKITLVSEIECKVSERGEREWGKTRKICAKLLALCRLK